MTLLDFLDKHFVGVSIVTIIVCSMIYGLIETRISRTPKDEKSED